MKNLTIIAVLLLSFSCKKENEDLLEGKWEEYSYFINDVKSDRQYGQPDTCFCEWAGIPGEKWGVPGEKSYTIRDLSWSFSDGVFSKDEKGENTSGCNYAMCEDSNAEHPYITTDTTHLWKGEYKVRNEGKGDVIDINLEDGTHLEVTIVKLDKRNLTIEYVLDSLDYYIHFNKDR